MRAEAQKAQTKPERRHCEEHDERDLFLLPKHGREGEHHDKFLFEEGRGQAQPRIRRGRKKEQEKPRKPSPAAADEDARRAKEERPEKDEERVPRERRFPRLRAKQNER